MAGGRIDLVRLAAPEIQGPGSIGHPVRGSQLIGRPYRHGVAITGDDYPEHRREAISGRTRTDGGLPGERGEGGEAGGVQDNRRDHEAGGPSPRLAVLPAMPQVTREGGAPPFPRQTGHLSPPGREGGAADGAKASSEAWARTA